MYKIDPGIDEERSAVFGIFWNWGKIIMVLGHVLYIVQIVVSSSGLAQIKVS